MSLMDKLKELQEAAPETIVEVEDLAKDDDVNIDPDTGADTKEKVEEPEVEEDTEDEEGEAEEKPEKPEVEGYRKRKIKAFEKEAQEAKERADRLEKQLMDLSSKLAEPRYIEQPKPKEEAVKVPDRYADPDAWVEHMLTQGQTGIESVQKELQAMKLEQVYSAAQSQLIDLENAYKVSNPSYDAVIKNAVDREVKREMALDPKANETAIRAKAVRERAELAAHFLRQGKDPVASIHNFMVEVYGDVPQETVKKDTNEKTKFEAVTKNKAKSATGLGSGGRNADSSEIVAGSGKKLSVAQFSKLSPEEKARAFSDRR